MTDETRRAGWTPGDPKAREAGRKGAAAARKNREQGKTPNAGAGRAKDKAPNRPGGGGLLGTARSVSAKTRQRITALVGTGIVLADEAMAKAVATWGEDKLDGDEVKLLTDAVVGTALRYPKVARRMEQAAVASEFAAIPTALLLIALPRLVRRGMVPRALATTVQPLLNDAQEVHDAGAKRDATDDEAARTAFVTADDLARERAETRAQDSAPADGEPRDEDEPPPAAVNADAPTPSPIRPPESARAAPGQSFRPPPGF